MCAPASARKQKATSARSKPLSYRGGFPRPRLDSNQRPRAGGKKGVGLASHRARLAHPCTGAGLSVTWTAGICLPVTGEKT